MVKIFIPQEITKVAYEKLKTIGDVTMYTGTDGPMPHDEILKEVTDKDILYALGEVEFDREIIMAAKPLKLVSAMHMKATFVDKKACSERKVPLCGIPNFVSKTTAEFTFALLMSTAWRLPEAQRYLQDGKWTQNQSTSFLGSRLYGKTIGIVGMGAVGTGVAKRAAACDMKVIYHKRQRLSAAEELVLGNAEYRAIEDLFMESDFVVLCTSLTNDTKGLVGEYLLSLMKPTSILINTSRGPILDEEALENALRSGQILGAGLDVYEIEVPEPNPGPRKGLYELENVVMTPHIGSAARETRDEMALRAVHNIERFLEGKRPFDVLNPEVYGEAASNDEVIG
jgi:glyoxylate reductase